MNLQLCTIKPTLLNNNLCIIHVLAIGIPLSQVVELEVIVIVVSNKKALNQSIASIILAKISNNFHKFWCNWHIEFVQCFFSCEFWYRTSSATFYYPFSFPQSSAQPLYVHMPILPLPEPWSGWLNWTLHDSACSRYTPSGKQPTVYCDSKGFY